MYVYLQSLPQTPQSGKAAMMNGSGGAQTATDGRESGGSLESVHDIQPSDDNVSQLGISSAVSSISSGIHLSWILAFKFCAI
jgi:hypothetical protein